MARLRALSDLRLDTRKLADLENATIRFPDSEVNEYVNKGIAHLYREIINVQDRPFFQKDYSFLTVGSNTPPSTSTQTTYPLPADFLQILAVLWATSPTGPWAPLDPYEEADRYALINSGFFGAQWPSGYGIVGGVGSFTQGTIPVAYSIEILPQPPSGSIVQVRYIPVPQRLGNDTDVLDSMVGYEEAVSTWAAILMRRKDDLDTADLERDFARHLLAVRNLAKRRDRSRPPKISIVRGRMNVYGRRAWGRMRGA